MEDWTQFISTRTFAKGVDYFETGCVHGLSKQADGWTATVSGYDGYGVFVPASLDPRRAHCSCPHYANGNICKHIAATILAIEQQAATAEAASSASAGETLSEIVKRVDTAELRAFVVEYATHDEAFERELRATFGVADAKEAKRELQKTTTALMRRYERGGFIDWRGALDFEHEYTTAIESIMRPFYAPDNTDALIDLVIPRLVQLQRICIDDSDGFFTSALGDVVEHMDKAFAQADAAQRQRLFDLLVAFLEKNPGGDRGDVYWFEQDDVEEFLADRFSQDVAFAPRMVELADAHLAELPPASEDTRDTHSYERAQWAGTRLKAMAALGQTVQDLRTYAEANGLLETADTIRLLADAYEKGGDAREAMLLLLNHLDAREPYRTIHTAARPQRLVDHLTKLARKTCTDEGLVGLYTALLMRGLDRATTTEDQGRWYDELHRLVGEEAWAATREKLLEDVSHATGNTLLAHEGSLEELYERIMAQGGSDLLRFESVLADRHPEPYIEAYIRDALSAMNRANDRRTYRGVAEKLAHAARLHGGAEPAREAASSLRAKYPRRPALHDELRKAGLVG